MRKNFKRIVVFTVGIIFVLLGIIGLALPFLQGFLFIIIGLLLLSVVSPAMRLWIEHHTRKFPKLHAMTEKMESWITKIIGRL